MNPTAGFLAGTATDLRDTVRAGSLEVDRAPVTNARYARFVEATGHRPPLYWPHGACPRSLLDHPVVGVDFFDALAFARWAGGALPTELQWAQASGLDEPRAYVWGDAFDPARCNTFRSGLKGTSPVGTFPEGTAPSGCVDLCGNVWELTCSPHPDDPHAVIVKGGSWYDYPVHAKIDASFRAGLNKCLATVGFRLVYGVEPRLPPAIDDAGLVERCLAFRRGGRGEEGDPGDAGEFEEVLASLRERAAEHLPGLDLEPVAAPSPVALEEALAVLDDTAGEAAQEPLPAETAPPSLRRQVGAAVAALRLPQGAAVALRRCVAAVRTFRAGRGQPWRARTRAALAEFHAVQAARSFAGRVRDAAAAWRAAPDPRVFERSWAYLRERPAVAMLGGCVAAGVLVGVLGAAVSSDDVGPRSLHADTPLPPAPPSPPATVRTVPARPASRGAARAGGGTATVAAQGKDNPVEQAIHDLLDGNGHRRDEAERYLIWHPDESYDRARAALSANLPAEMQASLRYVLAAIEEERAAPVAPTPVSGPPASGLAVFVDSVDAANSELIAMVRRTAHAEGLPFTVVLVTDEDMYAAIQRHGAGLGGSDVYADEGGRLVQERKLKQLPVVAAHRADGRIAFLLYGMVPRHRLAEGIARLRP